MSNRDHAEILRENFQMRNEIDVLREAVKRLQTELSNTLQLGAFEYFTQQRDESERLATMRLAMAEDWKQRAEAAEAEVERLKAENAALATHSTALGGVITELRQRAEAAEAALRRCFVSDAEGNFPNEGGYTPTLHPAARAVLDAKP